MAKAFLTRGVAIPTMCLLSLGLIGCSGGDNAPSTTIPAQAIIVTTAPPVATSTPQPAVFSPAKLAPALMAMERVNQLIGTAIQTQRDKTTDPQLPFSSVPAMGNTLAAQQVSLLYNSFQTTAAPPQGRPFNVQNTTQGYPTTANSSAAFAALKTAWQGNLFQNLQPQTDVGATWQESFCQLGNFVSAGQTSQWFVCMARTGNYIVTVSIGGLPGMDVNSVSQVVRTYFGEALRAVQ